MGIDYSFWKKVTSSVELPTEEVLSVFNLDPSEVGFFNGLNVLASLDEEDLLDFFDIEETLDGWFDARGNKIPTAAILELIEAINRYLNGPKVDVFKQIESAFESIRDKLYYVADTEGRKFLGKAKGVEDLLVFNNRGDIDEALTLYFYVDLALLILSELKQPVDPELLELWFPKPSEKEMDYSKMKFITDTDEEEEDEEEEEEDEVKELIVDEDEDIIIKELQKSLSEEEKLYESEEDDEDAGDEEEGLLDEEDEALEDEEDDEPRKARFRKALSLIEKASRETKIKAFAEKMVTAYWPFLVKKYGGEIILPDKDYDEELQDKVAEIEIKYSLVLPIKPF